MPIAFDDDAADALLTAVERAEARLRGQSRWRHTAASDAAEGFAGPAAEGFFEACRIEARDRIALAEVLGDLAGQLQKAMRAATAERRRQADLEAWNERESQRRSDRANHPSRAHDPGGAPDPRPPEVPIVPPMLEAEFRARDRPRALGSGHRGRTKGTISADPALLRRFARGAREANDELHTGYARVRASWAGFESSCGWVRLGAISFLPGFDRFLFWNDADADWAEKVADAFEEAGRGTLTSFAFTLAVGSPRERAGQAQRLLLDGGLSMDQVARAWQALQVNPAADTEALLERYADWFGQLDGLPALARARANQHRVPGLLAAAKADLAQVIGGRFGGDARRADSLRREIAYLERAQVPLGEKGGVQLYLYDREGSRIIEMFGTPGPDTVRAVTYVPGTFTGMDSFYTGGVQQVAQHLAANLPGTVAFAYKDGVFPGEERDGGDPDLWRIDEANDEGDARTAGEQLARFVRAMQTDPNLDGADHVGIGHSWGLANVTSSEVAGAHYDTVISLSGAGMLPDWKPAPRTGYFDLSYIDALQAAQRQGYVWEGNNPRRHGGFVKLPYYSGPDDKALRNESILGMKEGFDVLMENHSLIAKVNDANKEAVRDIRNLVRA